MPRGRPPACVFCGSTQSASKGVRRTMHMGIRRIRRCKKCGRKFTPRNQKPHIKTANPASVTSNRG